MIRAISFFLICFPILLFAQGQDWGDIAIEAYDAGDYQKAAAAAEQFFYEEPRSNMITRLAVRAYAQLDDTVQAIMHLQRYVYIQRSFGFEEFGDDLLADTALVSLREHEYFQEIIAEVRDWEAEFVAKGIRRRQRLDSLQLALEKNYDAFTAFNTENRMTKEQFSAAIADITYQHLPTSDGKRLHLYFKYQDTLRVPFVVVLPDDYDPAKAYPTLIGLHGGIWGIEEYDPFPGDNGANYGLSGHFPELAESRGFVRIFPEGTKYHNWIYPAAGFDLIPQLLAYVKRFVHLDDNRVHLIGHSNGAAGAFNYLVRRASPFAGFYGFNTRPYNYTGGTFLQNAQNRSFYNVSSDADYYYPGSAAKKIDSLARKMGIDWTDDFHPGTPHWWIYGEASGPALAKMLDDALPRYRNPFPSDLIWFADTLSEGRCDWIEITAFAPDQPRQVWADTLNFMTTDWVSVNDPTQKIDKQQLAFRYPRPYGGVKASFADNVFQIETSQVQALRLSLSQEMVDFTQPVKVYVNGQLVVTHQPKFQADLAIQHLLKTSDRSVIWSDEILVEW